MDEKKTAIDTNSASGTHPQRRQISADGRPKSPADTGKEYRKGLKDEGVELGVEKICNKGCQAVRQDLAAMERGERVPELKKLTSTQRREVYRQLQSIMAVYGDVCRLS